MRRICLSIALCCLSASCGSPHYPPSSGESDSSIADRLAGLAAHTACINSIGTLPNWPMLPMFRWILSPGEAVAVSEVDKALTADLPAEQMPAYRARARFIADNTTCTLVEERYSPDRVFNVFVFDQQSPVVPPSPTPKLQKVSTDALEQAWLDALNREWDRQTVRRTVTIPICNTPAGPIFITEVENSFARPIRIRNARNALTLALEHGDFDTAQTRLAELCQDDTTFACSQFQTLTDAARSIHGDFNTFARQFLFIESTRLKFVQPPNAAPYSSVKITLRNDSASPIHNAVLMTDERPPQYCILQASRNNRNDDPATLPPHSTSTAFCTLSPATLPTVSLVWNYADIRK